MPNVSLTKQHDLLSRYGKLVEPGTIRVQSVSRTRDLLLQSGLRYPKAWQYYSVKVVLDRHGRMLLDTKENRERIAKEAPTPKVQP